MDDNFLSPLIDGLSHAMQIRGVIQHQRLQSEALMRQKAQDQRENQIQDLQLKRVNAGDDMKTKMSMLEAGGKQVSPDGTYQAQAPGGASLGTALDSFVPGPQQMAVPADAGDTITAPSGTSFRLPSMQERMTAVNDQANSASARKRADEQVDLPGMGRVDQRAIPFISSRETNKATDAREDKKITATASEGALSRGNSLDIANLNQDGQNTRQGQQQTFQHGENALTRAAAAARSAKDDKPKSASAAQLTALDTNKGAAMTRAESTYALRVNAERQRAMRVNKKHPDSAMNPKVIEDAEIERAQAKQNADGVYVQGRQNYGLNADPVDYVGQLATQQQQGKAAPGAIVPAAPPVAAPATAPPVAPPAAAPAKLAVGTIVKHVDGKRYKITGYDAKGNPQGNPVQ